MHPPCFGLRFLERDPSLFLEPRPAAVIREIPLQFRNQPLELRLYRRADLLLQRFLPIEHRLPLINSGFATGPLRRPDDAPSPFSRTHRRATASSLEGRLRQDEFTHV